MRYIFKVLFVYVFLITTWWSQAALRRVIHECTGTPPHPLPADIERANYGLVKLQKVASFFDIFDKICDPLKVAASEQPLSMELTGQVGTYPSIFLDSGSFSVAEVVEHVQFSYVHGYIYFIPDVWVSTVCVGIPRKRCLQHPINSKGFSTHHFFR